MKALNATPREVRRIFADSYVIPDFQRPYTWEEEHCDILWEDIVSFHNSNADGEERYFLGNIVVHPSGGKFSVIDGQQRLTTLLLLIKAFHTRAGTYSKLQECYRISDKRTNELTDELRVKSDVMAEDALNLHKIMLNQIESADESCQLVVNYNFLLQKIDDWLRFNNSNSDAFMNLIDTLLDKIVLLPIECDSEDDALTIFQTINDRGEPLSDADIFKAKLYKSAPEDKRSLFIEDWNNLSNPERKFRIYMHIVRANEGETDKEKGLRSFFTDREKNRFLDWESVMLSLKKISSAYDDVWIGGNYGIINSLWAILETYPNQYWNYPIYVFLHKHGVYNAVDGFSLSDEHCVQLATLFEETTKYYFIRGLAHNSVNTVKDVTFRVCAKIASDDDYLSEFKSGITTNDKIQALQKLESGVLGRYRNGIVLLSAYLNPKQDRENLADMLWNNYHIEHILPHSWNHYDGWTQDSHDEHINSLGNLIPLEYKLNIKAQNEYLRKKKEYYAKSDVQDALDLLNIPDNGWVASTVEDVNKSKLDRLNDFFGLK